MYNYMIAWLVVSTPLKHMSSSVGMTVIPIYIYICIYIYTQIEVMFQSPPTRYDITMYNFMYIHVYYINIYIYIHV